MAEKIEFDLKVKENGLNKALDEGVKKTSLLENSLSTALGVFGGALITKGFDSLVGGLRSVISITGEAIDAAASQEVATNNLNNALARSGNLTKEATKALADYASQVQATSVFEDDAVLSNLALLQSLTRLSTEGLRQGVSAAADFATVLGIDLETATRLVAKAANGNTEAFKRYGVEIQKGSTDTETFANTVKALNGQFGGASAAQLNTYSGALKATKNAYGDLLEPIGDIIVKNPIIVASFVAIKDILNEANTAISESNGSMKSFVQDGILAGIAGAKVLFDALDGITVVFKAITNTVLLVGNAIHLGFIEPFRIAIDGVLKLGSLLPGIGDEIAKLNNPLAQTSATIKNDLVSAFEDLKNSADGNVFRSLSDGADSFANKIIETSATIQIANSELKNSDQGRLASEEETDAGILQRRAQLAQELKSLQISLASEQATIAEQLRQADLEAEGIRTEEGFTRLAEIKLREAEQVYQAELNKNLLVKDAQEKLAADKKALAARELSEAKINGQKELEIKRFVAAEERQIFNSRIAAASAFIGLGIALSKDGSVAAKTLASANAVLQTYAGANQVLADPTIPVLAKPAFIAAAIATGLANVARINGVQFANGGFIDGAGGATMGPDNTMASVRSGEMVLNADDQKVVFDAIKGGNLGGGGTIVVQIDGKEVARAVRNQIQQGFRLA